MNNATVVGLVPAAGRGQRIAPLPCSKELYPVGFRRDERTGEVRPKVVSHHLFDKFRAAGIDTAYVVVRSGKWDIPSYFVDGQVVGVDLAYVVIENSFGPADTLDRAYPFVREQTVAFGFPDILFGPDDVFAQLLAEADARGADAVLGLYLAHDVRLSDMVDADGSGRIRAMALKPVASDCQYTWSCAVWGARFTRFMHEVLAEERGKDVDARLAYRDIDPNGDLPVGAVIKSAVDHGLRVHGVAFREDDYFDIGTPENLFEVTRRSTCGIPV